MNDVESRISSNPGSVDGAEVILCRRKGPSATDLHSVTVFLRERGFHVEETGDGPMGPLRTRVLLVLGNANWFPEILEQLKTFPRSERPFVMIWHSEPLPPPRGSGLRRPGLHLREVLKILLRDSRATDVYTNFWRLKALHRKGLIDLIAVSNQSRQEFLRSHNIPAHWVPKGYNPAKHGFPMGLRREIDVLFLGTHDVPRRTRLLKRLAAAGISTDERGSWTDPACWGENRNKLINRSKIFLNLQRYEGDLSGLRMILGMANGALVVSEPIYRPAPYVPGKHYVSASLDEMPQAIRYYLEHDEERERITDEAYRFICENVTSEQVTRQVVELLRTHSPLAL